MSRFMPVVCDLLLHKMEKGELNLESKEALRGTLKEYEIHIKLIEQKLDECKKDHLHLQSEITKLVKENKDLTEQLKIASEKAIDKGEQALMSEKSDNLKQRLDLALEDRNTLEDMWKSSLRELETVKQKLKDCQSGKLLAKSQSKLRDVQKDYSEAIQILELKIANLKTENDQIKAKNMVMVNQLSQANEQITQLTEKNLSANNLLKQSTLQEQEWKSKYLLLETKYIELDKDYQADKVKFARIHEYERRESTLEGKLELAVRQRDDMQNALERCHERLSELMTSAASDRAKIEEAVRLVEEAMQWRDEALAREASSLEEMKRMKTELDKLVDEAGQKVGEGVAGVRDQFQQLVTTLREELQLVKQERDRKMLEVRQWQQECERLQDLMEQARTPADVMQRDKQNITQVFKELQLTEDECHQLSRENKQLFAENKQLHDSLSQLQESYKKNNRAKVRLKSELKQVQKKFHLCQHELSVTIERADLIRRQLQETNFELTQLQSEAVLSRDNGFNAQTKVSVANTIELYRRLDDSYGQMNDRWKNEMKTITDKFEEKLKRVKRKNKHREVLDEEGEHR